MSPWLFPTIALLVGLVAAVTDFRAGRIPNELTFSATILGLAGHSLHHGFAGFVESLLGIVICAAVPGILYKASNGRGIGGGDIKLFAALGALLGPSRGLEIELSSFLLIGIFAMFRLAFVGKLTTALLGSLRLTIGVLVPSLRNKANSNIAPMTEVRMGPAILLAVATVLSMPYLMRWLPWLG